MEERKYKAGKILLVAVKTAIGASLAIYLAECLRLQFHTSAGIIALLSVLTTKWGTLKLSLLRIVTFLFTAAACWLLLQYFRGDWIGFGIFLFFLVGICEWLDLRGTVSVNAVIATHFMTVRDFSVEFVCNELLLVLLGVTIAFVLNLFQGNRTYQKMIIENMRYTEQQLQEILEKLALYLEGESLESSVWDEIIAFEKELRGFVEQAWEYQNNTWHFHPGYYIDYFEMRLKQYGILHSLHYEIKKIRTIPAYAAVVADYIRYMKQYVVEINRPDSQIQRLHGIIEGMKQEELPESWELFEGKAKIYHILMDLEEFLICKKRFVEGLDEKKLRIYWNRE